MGYGGIDGCKIGWVVAAYDGKTARCQVCQTFEEAVAACDSMKCVFIDMPIGLSSDGNRQADVEARNFLPSHLKSSIFNTPVRDAVHARNKDEAKSINQKLTGKSLSEQSLGLFKKITEVDNFLQSQHSARKIFHEAHPEVRFSKYAGRPLKYGKKDLPGGLERLRILMQHIPEAEGILHAVRETHPPSKVAADDILDGLILALSAWGSKGQPQFFPAALDTPPTDETGLEMAIWFHDFAQQA